jgi:hypothetical protein
MEIEDQLRERPRKVEALYFGATSAGEREAAGAAAERLKAKLDEAARLDPPVEMKFSLPHEWSVRLFIPLCRRYGVRAAVLSAAAACAAFQLHGSSSSTRFRSCAALLEPVRRGARWRGVSTLFAERHFWRLQAKFALAPLMPAAARRIRGGGNYAMCDIPQSSSSFDAWLRQEWRPPPTPPPRR